MYFDNLSYEPRHTAVQLKWCRNVCIM